jgi:hypothetical protein
LANPEHLDKLREGVESWNQWRKQNPEITPELSEAGLDQAELNLSDLSGANLNRADLTRANLTRANLADATLRNAKFGRADLLNANLTGADLFGALLSNANLSGTDLSRTKLNRVELYGANLTQTILANTDFDQAKVGVTTFANVDLSQARNLETVRHREPSTIGIDTILQFRGKIPEEFFRGCGVPEEIIVYMRSLVGKPIEFYSCFISYSHADESFAQRLHYELQGRGIRCWLDKHQLLPGDDIYDEVDRGVRLWDKVLLCASKSSLTSPWVDDEITTAIEQEYLLWKKHDKKVLKLIPLNLDGYLFSGEWQSRKTAKIRSRLAPDFTGWESDNKKFEDQLELVIRALRSDGGGKETPPPSRL